MINILAQRETMSQLRSRESAVRARFTNTSAALLEIRLIHSLDIMSPTRAIQQFKRYHIDLAHQQGIMRDV